MKRGYAIAAIAVVLLVAVWIRQPDENPNERRAVSDHAATEVIVAEERIYCHDSEARPSYTVQLGGCLPGAREITDAQYREGIAAERATTPDN
ncbi:MAG: hypothetical protein J4F33_02965 [Alphaproteobacteria bacterium]|nr:hypothetical protein [Alphaproteobacteria bacterium]